MKCADAQTVTLQQDAFYPDSAICHTGVSVRFVGRVSYASYPANSSYTVVVHYGDGTVQTVTKTTGIVNSGSDTFGVAHAYATAGPRVVKAVAYTLAGTATDSIVRTWSVGGCSGTVSGRVFYDAVENCTLDSVELGLRNRHVPFVMNSAPRSLWTDSLGRYSSPLFPGDTLRRPAGWIDWPNASVVSDCPFAPAYSTATNRHVAVRLTEPVMMYNVQWPDYACKAPNPFPPYPTVYYGISTYGSSGYEWKTKLDLGDGTPPNGYFYSNAPNPQYNNLFYANAGTFTATLGLYNENYYGPVMEFKHTIQVDTCTAVPVRAFVDYSANCSYQSSEVPIAYQAVPLTSQIFGTQSVVTNDTGVAMVTVYDGDTLSFTGTSIYLPGGMSYDTLVPAACAPTLITQASTGLAPLPFKPRAFVTSFSGTGPVCLNEPHTISVGVNSIGLPAGTPLRLRGFYSDGGLDTTVIQVPTLVLGTTITQLTFQPVHRWQSAPASVTYVLDAPGIAADTASGGISNVNNSCWQNTVRAYRDLNRNCARDAAEPWVQNFSVSNGSWPATSNPATGIAAVTHYSNWPTITGVTVPAGSPGGPGEYTAIGTAPFCAWQSPSSPGGQVALPLIDTARFSAFVHVNPVTPCSTVATGSVTLTVLPNWTSRPYLLTYYYGDGSSTTQPFNPANSTLVTIATGPHTYAAGTYNVGLSVYDSVLGQTVFSYTHPLALTITDTCTGFKGRLFADGDANCVYNAGGGDVPYSGVAVSGTRNGVPFSVMTDASGRFRVFALSGDALVVNVPSSLGGRALACSTATSTLR